MKNPRMEQKIKKAKHYAKIWGSNHRLNSQGNYIVHSYNEVRQFSWGDDVLFKLGSQLIAVDWIHPRQHYHNLCKNQIDLQMPIPPVISDDIFSATPNYKLVGKTGKRKKIKSYTMSEFNPELKNYFQKQKNATKALLNNGNIVAQPFFKIQQENWCRYVEICLPIEIFNENDVNHLAEITKKLILRQTTLDELFPNYQYDKHDWQKEQHQEL